MNLAIDNRSTNLNMEHALPPQLAEEIGETLGSPIVSARQLAGGFTPQQIVHLTLADASTSVVKLAVASEEPGPDWQKEMMRELMAYDLLYALSEWMPGVYGGFVEDGYTALLIEDLTAATTVPPWSAEAIDIVAEGLARMHRTSIETPIADVPSVPHLPWFDRIRERGRVDGEIPTSWLRAPGWWEWVEEASTAGSRALEAFESLPRVAIHFDVRSDNLFIRDGKLVLIDWTLAGIGPATLDSVYWAIGVQVDGGGDARSVHEHYLRHASDPTDAGVRYALAYMVGFFIDGLQRGGVSDAVTDLRLRYLTATLPWFCKELDLPTPPLPLPTEST